jgi:hypothetical protein
MRTKLSLLVDSGEIFLWEPSLQGDAAKRALFVTREVVEGMDPGTWTDEAFALRYAQLSTDFDRFVDGSMIPVGMSPYDKDDSAFMARVDPADYGIWTIRSVAPRPALRVFGAFCEVDVFLALSVEERAVLGGRGSREWANARENALARWNALLPGERPIVGRKVDDYISEKTLAV